MYQPKFGRHYAKGQTAGGPWSQNERKPYINVLEIKEAKLAIMAFTIAKKKGISIHVIIERGGGGGGEGHKNSGIGRHQQRNLGNILPNKITIIAEYLPEVSQIVRGTLDIDLFVFSNSLTFNCYTPCLLFMFAFSKDDDGL